MSLLELNNVHKYYPIGRDHQFHALKGINLSFEAGELVSIVGESGSGKSTLMNLLGGLDTDFSGEIIVDGANIGKYNEKNLVKYHKEKIGFVFQNFNLIPHLSVLENVALAMTLSNIPKKVRIEHAKQTLAMVGLKDHYYKKPNQLSGGQKQRVAIARALVNNPEIIIADEPTGALDSETSEQVLDIFKEIAANGKLVLIVTHSERVASISSRIVTIADGQIIGDQQLPENMAAIADQNTHNHFASIERSRNRNLGFLAAVKLALQNMQEKWARNTLIAFGGSIGIMSIILMLSLGAGVNGYLTDTMNAQINPVVNEVRMPAAARETATATAAESELPADQAAFLPGGAAEMMENAPQPKTLLQNEPFAQADIDKIVNLAGVSDYEKGYSSFSLRSFSVGDANGNYDFMNLQTVSSIMTESNIAQGALPAEGEIMITQGMADSMGGEVIGKEVTVNFHVSDTAVSKPFVISGIYTSGEAIGPTAVFDGVYINYADVEKAAKDNGAELAPNAIYLVAADAGASAQVRQAFKDLGYKGSAIDSLAETFTQMIDIFTYILVGVAALSLIVSAIMILTVLYISVIERTQEIGVIKAIGGRRKDIRRIFASESFLIGLFSGLIGVGLAAILAFAGNEVIFSIFGTTIFTFKSEYALAGIAISVIISMIAGLFPANAASRLDPVEALRKE